MSDQITAAFHALILLGCTIMAIAEPSTPRILAAVIWAVVFGMSVMVWVYNR